jgi:uncharacterized protein YqgV (UPF0045/DUF77 family)
MKLSVEISMYPLTEGYIAPIDNFLEQLHAVENLKVVTNPMSTQVFGESKLIFDTLHRLIEKVYGELKQCPFMIKVLNSDVSNSEIKDY